MSPSQIIVLATPVFLGLIAVEFAWGRLRQRNTYRLNDAISSIGLGMLSQISAVFTRLLRVDLYTAVYAHLSLVPADAAQAFWTSLPGWLLALVFYDFCYYWLHRAGHRSAVFWAAHVVHHQSQSYNLSTALRQTSTGALLSWVFYLPMALAGVPPLVFGVVALIDLLYQFWVHTEHVPRLGWFDRWFCSPSNHRVHHAVNGAYLDRNYGGVLIVWDRLFGTFAEEDPHNPCVYGTRKPLRSWDPLWANAEVYRNLLHDSWHTRRWRDKLAVWFRPSGWRPADVAERFPREPFDMTRVQTYDPPMSPARRWFSALAFAALLGGVSVFLWHADRVPLAQSGVWCLALTAVLWATSAVMQGRMGIPMALAVMLAAASTATSATGLPDLHRLAKPAAMLALMAAVWLGRQGSPAQRALLLAALAASLAGDVALMLPGAFVPGLVAFLIAHLVYLALFSRDSAWFAHRGALGVMLVVGGTMLAVLWLGGLPPALRVPVAVYALVISLMAAQAIGRAAAASDGAARASARSVALGAVLFVASDALLAYNRFVSPLPLAQLLVLSTYYAAQLLIAGHVLRATGSRKA